MKTVKINLGILEGLICEGCVIHYPASPATEPTKFKVLGKEFTNPGQPARPSYKVTVTKGLGQYDEIQGVGTDGKTLFLFVDDGEDDEMRIELYSEIDESSDEAAAH